MIYTLLAVGLLSATLYRLISRRLRAIYIIIISLGFYYALAGAIAVIILLIESLIGYSVIYTLEKIKNNEAGRRICLASGVCITSITLAFFKYSNHLSNMAGIFGRIVIPLGISYYSFKIISSIVDGYRNKYSKAVFIEYFAYISFFPQIICGPISRYNEIVDQLDNDCSNEDVRFGLYGLLKGIFYKLVIADRLSEYNSKIFGDYGNYNTYALWMAVILYAVELYCDFAGYSYIAIGICRIMGIRIKDNFQCPYFSSSVKEFWTRWHISLSEWLRDYIYIPLGGSRYSRLRHIVNVLIVFLISGIWHGDTLVYILWGIWHGMWNIILPKDYKTSLTRILGRIITFFVVAVGWIAFKMETIHDVVSYIAKMFQRPDGIIAAIVSAVLPFSGDYSCLAKFTVVIVILVLLSIMEYREYRGYTENRLLRVCVYIPMIVFFGVIGNNGFIYANY